MHDHTIKITLDDRGNPVPLSADGKSRETHRAVKASDRIRWISDHGEVEVGFPAATPLADGMTTGNATFRVVAPVSGAFEYRCTLTTPDGRKHGWPVSSEGGGFVEVGSGSQTGS